MNLDKKNGPENGKKNSFPAVGEEHKSGLVGTTVNGVFVTKMDCFRFVVGLLHSHLVKRILQRQSQCTSDETIDKFAERMSGHATSTTNLPEDKWYDLVLLQEKLESYVSVSSVQAFFRDVQGVHRPGAISDKVNKFLVENTQVFRYVCFTEQWVVKVLVGLAQIPKSDKVQDIVRKDLKKTIEKLRTELNIEPPKAQKQKSRLAPKNWLKK